MTLSDLGSRLTAKGYQVVQSPNIAYYIVLTNIVYCNLTKTELPVQDMVASGYGSGIGSSIMGGLQGLTSMASMAGPAGMMIGSVASTALDVGSSVGSLFSGGPSRPSANENMKYACVADLQITERKLGESLPTERQVAPPPGVHQTRLAASVDQKKLDEPEATPLVQQKLSAAVAGHF